MQENSSETNSMQVEDNDESVEFERHMVNEDSDEVADNNGDDLP